MNKQFLLFLFTIIYIQAISQNRATCLRLDEAIILACDSSLEAFIAENAFLTQYWLYKNYKAGKLPFIDLNAVPLDFKRSVDNQYNFADSSYHYINKQTLTSYLNLSINQNITGTGGKVYIDSDVSRLQNLNNTTVPQYSSTLIRVGVEQQLFGYNPFKWDDKIKPLEFEHAKQKYISSTLDIAIQTIKSYFDVLQKKQQSELAQEELVISLTLLDIGKERYKIGSINTEDLYTLEIDYIKAKNSVLETLRSYKWASSNFKSFLRLDNNANIELMYPDSLLNVTISPLVATEKAFMYNPEMKQLDLDILEAAKYSDYTKREKRFKANVNASFGLNQTANSYINSLKTPQDYGSINLSLKVPILDWGVSKTAYKAALQSEEVIKLSTERAKVDIENLIINQVDKYSYQHEFVQNAKNILEVSKKTYDLSIEKYRSGTIDLLRLNMAKDYWVNAKYDYLVSLKAYWETFYNIKKLTLYDFSSQKSLSESFDDIFIINEQNY